MDLHIHSCLSPCGDDSMVPERVVLQALEEDLQVVGICDHNTAGNVPAFRETGRRMGLTVLGGMEITSREEIHVLALFDDGESLRRMEERVGRHLEGENNPEAFGDQVLVDAEGLAVGLDERLLIGAVALTLAEIVTAIHEAGGLAIASHVDREMFGIIGQLGFIPDGLDLDAVELSPNYCPHRPIDLRGLPAVAFSDAHFPEEIGSARTRFRVEEASVPEIRSALRNRRPWCAPRPRRGKGALYGRGGRGFEPVWKRSPCT